MLSLASKQRLNATPQWPFLERLLHAACLPYIDFLLAETILDKTPITSEALAAFICHLSLAARSGHLCISIEDDCIEPSPSLLWNASLAQENSSLSESDLKQLHSLILQGAQEIPLELIADFTNTSTPSEASEAPLCRFKNLFYLQRYWFYETEVLNHYSQWITQSPHLKLDESFIQNRLKTLREAQILLPEQADAVLKACLNNFAIICGGPGTGKTYTAGHLISLYWEALPPEHREKCVIALAAPTGKAAANLQKSLMQATAKLENFKPITSKTLHSLLGINSKSYDDLPPSIDADLLIVDESSMIDVKLMATLFSALKPGSRLIMLGDPHQLPSVEAGAIFSDLLKLQQKNTSTSSIVLLKKCLRAELKEIVDLAAVVNEGRAKQAINMLQAKDKQGLSKVSFPNEESLTTSDLQAKIIQYAAPHFSCSVKEQSPQELMSYFNQFRMLSPLRKGPFGVNEINSGLYKKMAKQKSCFAVPIMLTAHDARLGLFNGEVGVLVRYPTHDPDHHFQKGDYALFFDKQGGIMRLPAVLLPKFEYAFCLSVHKSQGSEFDRVFLLLPEGSQYFGREVFYTALTRAKKRLEVWGADAIIQQTVETKADRLSGLQFRYQVFECNHSL